jgi:hypothetical protein
MKRPKALAKFKPLSNERTRFEIIIFYGNQTIKHICVAEDQDAASGKIMRQYAKFDPQLKRVIPLGPLPQKKGRKATVVRT